MNVDLIIINKANMKSSLHFPLLTKNSNIEILKLLIKNKCNVNFKDKFN